MEMGSANARQRVLVYISDRVTVLLTMSVGMSVVLPSLALLCLSMYHLVSVTETKQLNYDTTALLEAASSHPPRPRSEMLNCHHAQKVSVSHCPMQYSHQQVAGQSLRIASWKTAGL